MKNYMTFFSIILSSTVLSGIISSIISMIINKKNVYIENITKERKEWREEIRVISNQIIECRKNSELINLTYKLKLRINSNGITTYHILDDSYLWEYINKIEEDKIELNKAKNDIVSLISCLLKYDWERSKEEISGNKQIKFLLISHFIGFVYFTISFFIQNTPMNINKGIVYLEFCILFTTMIYVCIMLLLNTNSWKNRKGFLINISTFITVLLTYLVLFGIFIYSSIKHSNLNMIIFDWIIIINPIFSMIYSYLVKVTKYRNNVGKLLLSVMTILNKQDIPKRFVCFVRHDISKDINTYRENNKESSLFL